MSENTISMQSHEGAGDRALMRRLMLFFAVVYVVEGLGQTGGLVAQPLNYYLKQVHGWTPVQVTAYVTLFNLPWVIKPIYGLISDFVPFLGYRRKSYLLIANLVAAGAYLSITQLTQPSHIAAALLVTAFGMAISSALCGAVLVENGQRLHESGTFVNQQWLWFNIAFICGSILSGVLVQRLPPTLALHVAVGVVAVAPLAVIFGTLRLIPEEKTAINLQELRKALHSLLAAFRKRELWVVGLFLFLYYFSPGFSTPLYYHMTDNLKFSQAYIGVLGSISAAGWVVGALVYHRLFDGLSSKQLINLSITMGTVSSLSFLLLSNETNAAILNFCSGFSAMLATVATLTLAADFCPPRSEGFSFAILASVTNLSGAASDNVGAYLYENLFNRSLTPLIVVSSVFTAFAFVLVPLLRLGNKRQGQPAAAAG